MLIDLKFTFLSLCKTTESTFLVGSIEEQYCFILHCGCLYQEFPFHKWGMGVGSQHHTDLWSKGRQRYCLLPEYKHAHKGVYQYIVQKTIKKQVTYLF